MQKINIQRYISYRSDANTEEKMELNCLKTHERIKKHQVICQFYNLFIPFVCYTHIVVARERLWRLQVRDCEIERGTCGNDKLGPMHRDIIIHIEECPGSFPAFTPYPPIPHIPGAKFIVLDWGDKVNSDIGMWYRPTRLYRLAGWCDNPKPESTISASQWLWI